MHIRFTIINARSVWLMFIGILVFSYALIGKASDSNEQWDERVSRGSLANGLDYYLYDSEKPDEPFNIRLIVHAGAIDEEDEQIGVAHMLEHMVFHQTKAHPEGVFNYLDSIAWKTGKEVNALTRPEVTQYMIRTRPNDNLNLEQSLALLADMAFGASLREQDWALERKIIMEEWRQGESVAQRVNSLKKQVTRNGSHYTNRAPIGTPESIATMPLAQLRAFYDKWYVASNMSLIVSGSIDKAEAFAAIQQHFGTQPRHPKPKAKPRDVPLKNQLHIGQVQDYQGISRRVVFAHRFSMLAGSGFGEQSCAGADFGFSEQGCSTDQAPLPYQVRLQNYVLRKLIGKRFRALSASFAGSDSVDGFSAVLKDISPRQFTLAFAARGAATNGNLKHLLGAIEQFKRAGFSQAALNQLKRKMRRIAKRNVGSAKRRSYSQWEDKITNAILAKKPLISPEQQLAQVESYLDQITLAKVNARLRHWLAEPDRFVYFQAAANDELSLPSEAQVTAWQQALVKAPLESAAPNAFARAKTKAEQMPLNAIQAHADQTAVAREYAPFPVKARALNPSEGIQGYHYDREHHVHEWRLSNGDRVIWLERATENNKLFIRAISAAGYANQASPSWLNQSALQLTEQSGLAGDNWGAELTQAWLKQQGIQWQWKQSEGQLDLATSLKRDQLGVGIAFYQQLQMAHWIAPDAIEALKKDLRRIIAQSDARQHIGLRVAEVIARYQQHVLAQPELLPSLEALEALTLTQLQDTAARALALPTDMFIVGEYDQEALEHLVLKHIAPINRSAGQLVQGGVKLEKRRLAVNSKQKEFVHHFISRPQGIERATVYSYGLADLAWTPERAFVLTALNPLYQNALKQRLRRELGGIYSLEFEFAFDSFRHQISSRMKFTAAPQRAKTLQAEALKALEGYTPNLNQAALARLKADVRMAENLRLAQANTWLHRLILSYRAYNDARYLSSMEPLADNLSTQIFQALAADIANNIQRFNLIVEERVER